MNTKLPQPLFYILFLLILAAGDLTAQLSGLITSNTNEPLPFASIYVQGTTKGTTSNVDGKYYFELAPGNYKIVCQYVGYEQKVFEVTMADQPQVLNITLGKESVQLTEVVIRANAEDPAYPIIRKAIAKRKYYKELVQSFECDVYIKGNQRLLKAPEKILGQEIGDMGGTLDSTGQGIIYLSESQAKLSRAQPDRVKEEMHSSKVSGNDNGFGFNRASLMDFDFYNNHVNIERELLSPIANTALQYYRYKLMGTFFDENGYEINKIQVLKKRESDPVVSGFIYIVEDLWNIHSTELYVTGKAIKQSALDTLVITQVHVPVEDPDKWMLLSQSLDFKFGFLGFEAEGNFTGVFSNYELNTTFPDKFFSQEIFKVEEGANEKTQVYWDSIRPIPLTVEEGLDYVKKDSLQRIWESKPFLDSLDRKNNKFKVWDVLLGYTWRNSFEKKSFSFQSPLSTILFNPVQGYYVNLNMSYNKTFDKYDTRRLKLGGFLQYGFSDEKLRGEGEIVYNFNQTKFTRLRIIGGSATRQFNGGNPVNREFNSFTSSFQHRNYLHLYQREFGKIKLRHELFNGLLFDGGFEYENRTYLNNTSESSIFKRDDFFEPNNAILVREGVPSPEQHQAFIFNASFRVRIKQKYLTYPQRKFIVGSDKPDVWIHYRRGIKAFGSDVDFDQLWINYWDEITFGLVGRTAFNLEAGTFLRKNNLRFIDWQHFSGNQFLVVNSSKYLQTFLLLPYYERSVDGAWTQMHFRHNFDGYLLDKVPLLRKLGWKTVVGAAFLYTGSQKEYFEFNVGLDNLGFKAFRLLRLDLVFSYDQWKHRRTGFIIGIGF